MNEIKINEHKINVPSHWEELRPEDLIYLGANFPFTDTPKFHLETFIYFCNLKFRFALKNVIRNLNASQLHDILSMGGKGALFMYLYKNPVMQKWKIKEIKAAGTLLYAPADRLDNVRFGEFRYAEECLQNYLQSKNPEALATFVAILYREKGNAKGDMRLPFDKLTVDQRAAKLLRVNPFTLHAIMLQYIAIRGFVIESFPGVFEKTGGGGSGGGWGELINALAENLSNRAEIENKLLWDALDWLQDARKRQKKKPQPQTT